MARNRRQPRRSIDDRTYYGHIQMVATPRRRLIRRPRRRNSLYFSPTNYVKRRLRPSFPIITFAHAVKRKKLKRYVRRKLASRLPFGAGLLHSLEARQYKCKKNKNIRQHNYFKAQAMGGAKRYSKRRSYKSCQV